jgi:hypothetical protein
MKKSSREGTEVSQEFHISSGSATRAEAMAHS